MNKTVNQNLIEQKKATPTNNDIKDRKIAKGGVRSLIDDAVFQLRNTV